jgi:hypothetical protein
MKKTGNTDLRQTPIGIMAFIILISGLAHRQSTEEMIRSSVKMI